MTELGKRGMQFNGSTNTDRTNYFESFTANPQSLDWALSMEADRMVNSYIRRSDLDTEMTVVRNEFESGENNPQLVLLGKMLASAYQWHNYAHLPIGARSDIENVNIERLQAFYRMYYQPDNAVLIVAGKFDVDTTLSAIAKYFGPDPEADAQAARHLHGGSGAGRRAHGDAAPRRQLQIPRDDVPHGARRATRITSPPTCWATC